MQDNVINKDELNSLNRIAEEVGYRTILMDQLIEYCFNIFCRHSRGSTAIEIGPAEGVMTNLLLSRFPNVAVIEGSQSFVDTLRCRYPMLDIHHSLIECFDGKQKYSNVVLSQVLEHVSNPSYALEKAKHLVAAGGIIFAAVPNANSLHRKAAVKLGMLDNCHQLSQTDIAHGHRRVYDPDSFYNLFKSQGLKVEHRGGYFLKFLSNRQTCDMLNKEIIQAYFELGEEYPDDAAEIYIVATLDS